MVAEANPRTIISRKNAGPDETRAPTGHPMLTGNPASAPRCGAKTRAGGICRAPAMCNQHGKYTRCRMHGGASTGPRTPEGRERCAKAQWKHGRRSKQFRAERQGFAARHKWRSQVIDAVVEFESLNALLLQIEAKLNAGDGKGLQSLCEKAIPMLRTRIEAIFPTSPCASEQRRTRRRKGYRLNSKLLHGLKIGASGGSPNATREAIFG